jgi:hypothetical protein
MISGLGAARSPYRNFPAIFGGAVGLSIGRLATGRPARATLRHAITSGPTTLRALDGGPSGVPLCADHLEPHPTTPGGSIFTINTGSVYQIGPTWFKIMP